LRFLCSSAAGRMMFGAVGGLVIGSLSAIAGICLSGVDVREPAMFIPMVGLVILSAAWWAAILACVSDCKYFYLRFLKWQETRQPRPVPRRYRHIWEGAFGGLPPAILRTEKPKSPDQSALREL
jgi:hypothetical protein